MCHHLENHMYSSTYKLQSLDQSSRWQNHCHQYLPSQNTNNKAILRNYQSSLSNHLHHPHLHWYQAHRTNNITMHHLCLKSRQNQYLHQRCKFLDERTNNTAKCYLCRLHQINHPTIEVIYRRSSFSNSDTIYFHDLAFPEKSQHTDLHCPYTNTKTRNTCLYRLDLLELILQLGDSLLLMPDTFTVLHHQIHLVRFL